MRTAGGPAATAVPNAADGYVGDWNPRGDGRIVFAALDPDLARTEPDPEIHALIHDSAGLNLALDYLPGSVTYDPIVEQLDADLASRIVWLDAFTTNPDRTHRNPNLMVWQGKVWLIDHGAAFFYQHNWNAFLENAKNPFRQVKDHILLPFAGEIE